MKTSTLLAAAAAALFATSFAHAETASTIEPRTASQSSTASYDASTRHLSIPSLQIGTLVYSNVVLRFDGGAVISVGASAPVTTGSIAHTCTTSNFSTAKYNAITSGLTVDQISAQLGCKSNPAGTIRMSGFTMFCWGDPDGAFISVYFNFDGSLSTTLGSTLKVSHGW
jgi:hypothetical protein